MATEENVNPTEGQEQENDYRETLLVRNPDSGQVEAVSKLITKGDRREVHTVQPLAKNRPAFYPFRSSNAVAAFIRGFKSQKDNPIQFQFLKVPILSVGKIVTSLGKLVSNPKSEEGWETYNKYVVNTAELEQVKYDKAEIPRAELQELGIDFDALPQRTQRSLMLGLPTRELFPATVQLSDHGTTTGLFNLSFYRDHNDELKFRLDTPLVQPEYEREEYASEITPDDKALLARGKTLQHLVTVHNSITGEAERCHVAFNPSTNRLVAVPHRDVKIPEFAEGRRIDDAGQKILRSGGSIPLEGCTAYGDTENTYKGILNYDVYRGRYTISDPVYDKPYVPKYLRDQLSDADVKTLLAGGQVSADQVKDSFGEPMKNKVLYVNPRDNRTYSRFLSRQERSEAAEASHQATQGADESQQGRGRKR